MNHYLYLILPLLILGGILSAVAGGGFGILAVVVASFFLDIRTNIALISTLMLTPELAKFISFRAYILWNIVGWYVLLGIPMSFVGGYLLFIVPERIPEVGLGFMCLLFVIMHFTKRMPRLVPSKMMLISLGAVNGFIGGLIGNAALIRMPALMSMGITKEVFVGTSAAVAFLMNFSKVSAYVPNITWTPFFVQLFLLSIPCIFLGVYLGKKLLHFVSPALFENLQLGIITIGAIRLIFFP